MLASMDGGGNFFNVFVDDELVRVLQTYEGWSIYELCCVAWRAR